MTNFPSAKKVVKLSDKEVVIHDLSLGFLLDYESKNTDDSFISIISDATDLNEQEIRKLRKSEAEFLTKEIMLLTYGEEVEESVEGGNEKK